MAPGVSRCAGGSPNAISVRGPLGKVTLFAECSRKILASPAAPGAGSSVHITKAWSLSLNTAASCGA
jgi:hypothetical protein